MDLLQFKILSCEVGIIGIRLTSDVKITIVPPEIHASLNRRFEVWLQKA